MSSHPPTPIPPKGLTLANGDPLPEGIDLFAPPPPEIGEPFAATSTLRQSMKPQSPQTDKVVASVVQLACVVVLVIAIGKEHGFSAGTVIAGVVVGLAIGTPLGLWMIKQVGSAGFIGNVYYISPHGVARIRCQGDRDKINLRHTMLFEEETDLLTGAISQSLEGIHMSTDTWYHWTDAEGNTLMLIDGSNPNQHGPAPAQHPLRLGELAARMWLERRRPQLLAQFQARGRLDFRVDKMGHIRLERGAIGFHFRGSDVRILAAEIIDLTLANGIFRLRYDQPGVGRKSIPIQFAYANVANVVVFLELLAVAMPGIFGGGDSTAAR